MKNNGSSPLIDILQASWDRLDPFPGEVIRELLGIKFSPYPWSQKDFKGWPLIETRDRKVVAIVAQRNVGKEAAQANATLMTLAPQIYEALDNLVVSSYDPDEGDCLICGALSAWGAAAHEPGCEVAAAAAVLALARGET